MFSTELHNESLHSKLRVAVGCNLLLSGIFFCTALFVPGECYFTPCEQGEEGLMLMTRVNGGLSFSTFLSASTVLAFAAFGVQCFYFQPSMLQDSFRLGMFTAALALCWLIEMCLMVTWQSQSAMIDHLNGFYVSEGSLIEVNEAAKPMFTVLSVVSTLNWVVMCVMAALYVVLLQRGVIGESDDGFVSFNSEHAMGSSGRGGLRSASTGYQGNEDGQSEYGLGDELDEGV